MLFLKSLLFIIFNMAVVYVVLDFLRGLLFNPKQRYFFGKKIPWTPGFLYRKKVWLITKLHFILNDYLSQATDLLNQKGYLHEWEEKVKTIASEKLESIYQIKILPWSWKAKIHQTLVNLVLDVVKQILRNLVPFLIEKYQISSYIELLDRKLDMEVIREFFNKKIYKWILLFFESIAFIVGLFNMLFYLIIS